MINIATTSPLKVLVAGSTSHTLQLIEALAKDDRITITGVITPVAKPIGRAQTLTSNPVENWAKNRDLQILTVFEKIDQKLQNSIIEHKNSFGCDLLLVVDFGYFLPNWLLKIPQIAPVNVHPSRLPAWRGSSPGQRVILAGETHSAVSVILVTDKLDQGDILAQIPFEVEPSWDAATYYQAAFDLISAQLANILVDFATGKINLLPQPIDSPTPMADRLTKVDSFIPWDWIVATCDLGQVTDLKSSTNAVGLIQKLGEKLWQNHQTEELARLLHQASLAFSPWPKLWTLLPTPKGNLRLIIHQTSLSDSKQLKLEKVQLEGKSPTTWPEIKNNWQK